MHKTFVENIFEEKAVNSKISKDLSNTLDILSKTVFGDINRFIFELLQNGDDAAENGVPLHVKFRLLDHYLVFSHNGKHFTFDDVEGISSVGSRTSQKDRDSEKTGYKGIGFKSVFGSSDYAYISSGGFKFRFDKSFFENPNEYPWQVIPIWTDTPPVEVEKWFDSNEVNTAIGVRNRELILKEIKEVFDDCQIILFLRNIQTITFYNGDQLDFTISRQSNEDHTLLYNNGELESSWILKTIEFPVDNKLSQQLLKLSETECPRKLMEAKKTKLIFAAKVENGRIVPLQQTVIYCYLPTKAQKGFPFLINGDFLTNAERTGLMQNIWNEFLFQEIATKQLEWLSDLLKTNYKYDILHLLKEKYPSFSDYGIEHAYNTGLDSAAKRIKCLPVLNDQTSSSTIANSVTDVDHLTDFLGADNLLYFLGWPDSCSILDLRLERQEVLSELGNKKFCFKDVFAMIASGKANDINSAIRFMTFFYNNTVNGENVAWLSDLQTVPFIMDEAGAYKRASEIFVPAAQRMNYEGLGSISYIHPAILTHFKDVLSHFVLWLGKLGIKEPDNVEIFRKAVLPLVLSDGMVEKNYLHITNFIFITHQSKLLTEQDYEHLKKLPVSTNNGFQKPSSTYLSDDYNPDQKLSVILSQANFLSKVYINGEQEKKVDWKVFFKRIGVRDKIRIDVLETKTERTAFVREHPEAEAYFDWLDNTQAYATVYFRYRLSGQHYIGNFTQMEFRTHLAEPNFSKLFWSSVLDDWEDFKNRCNNTVYYHIGGSESVPSYVKYYVTNFPSVPANDGNCHVSTSLFSPALRPIIGEYIPTADFAASITKEQISFFGFKTELSLKECLHLMDHLASNELTTERRKQVFAIYDHMVGNTLYGKQEIMEWRKDARLLSMNNTYQPIDMLYIFNIYGNIRPGNTERFLKVPTGKSVDEINALAKLLMVPIISIDMLEFVKKGETEDVNLKTIISQKLVYLSIIYAHNSGDNVKTVADRLRVMVEARTFYQAEELKLMYTSKEGEVIIDNEIDVWNSTTSAIYYSGYWRSPLVLYSLSSILCEILQLKDMERELALILQLSDKEIKQWLKKNSYSVELIEEFDLFEADYQEVEQISDYSESISTEIELETLKVEIFEEKVKVKDIDFSAIIPVQKTLSDIPSSIAIDYKTIENSAVRTDIGRWSEEYIYEYFMSNPTIFTSINWVNEQEESNLPYDFEVVENGIERLIEVKGTPSLNKNLIYLSKKEWQVMMETGKAYSIFRVYGAGSESNFMHRIDDVQSLINTGSIDFSVEIYL